MCVCACVRACVKRMSERFVEVSWSRPKFGVSKSSLEYSAVSKAREHGLKKALLLAML
jgi:hypothetical protein